MLRKIGSSLIIGLALLLAACSQATKAQDAMPVSTATEAAMALNTPIPDAGITQDAPSATKASQWMNTPLAHAVTGKTFMVQDFQGKVTLVETFAQWCSTCLAQQKQVVKLHELVGMNSDLVSVNLDIDPNEDVSSLKVYLEKNGFDWYYAVAPKDVSRMISELYGNQFLNPPSAPMLVIDRHGTVHPLPFGLKSAEDLQKAIEPYLKETM